MSIFHWGYMFQGIPTTNVPIKTAHILINLWATSHTVQDRYIVKYQKLVYICPHIFLRADIFRSPQNMDLKGIVVRIQCTNQTVSTIQMSKKTKKKSRYDNNEYFMGINNVSITNSSVLLTSTPDKIIKIWCLKSFQAPWTFMLDLKHT